MSTQRTMTKSRRNANKQPCPQGRNCPYRDEYQHQKEFHHDNPPTNSQRSFFAGKGHVLGGGANGRHLVDFLENDFSFNNKSSPISKRRKTQDENTVHCPRCGEFVDVIDLDQHLLIHESMQDQNIKPKATTSNVPSSDHQTSSRDEIAKQNREYDDCLLQDILKASLQENQSNLRKINQRQEEEEEQFRKRLEESRNEALMAAKISAINRLGPAPSPENYNGRIIAIKFKLPSGKRLIRNFREDDNLERCFDFILGSEEVPLGQHFRLRDGLSTKQYTCAQPTLSLKEAFPNHDSCVLIVEFIDIKDEKITPPTISIEVNNVIDLT